MSLKCLLKTYSRVYLFDVDLIVVCVGGFRRDRTRYAAALACVWVIERKWYVLAENITIDDGRQRVGILVWKTKLNTCH